MNSLRKPVASDTKSSGVFLAATGVERARAALERGESVVVVALCAERALVLLGVSPGSYSVTDEGPTSAGKARRYRVQLKHTEHVHLKG